MRKIALLPLGLTLALAGCEKDGAASGEDASPYEVTRAAWEGADLEVEEMSAVEKGGIQGAESCEAGVVSGVHVLVCEFADAAAAEKAEERGLGRVGDGTGLSIARERMLLVVADADKADPNGKTINKIGQSFRKIEVPTASAKPAEAETEQAPE